MNDLYTRLRFYNLPDHGLSMSLSVDNSFILIEARYNDSNKQKIKEEMEIAGCSSIDLLHISNWDSSRCSANELKDLLSDLQPTEIEIPQYDPEDNDQKICKKLINEYAISNPFVDIFEAGYKNLVNPSTLDDLDYTDIILSPLSKQARDSDLSIIKLFWQGRISFLNTSCSTVDNFSDSLLNIIHAQHIDVAFLSTKESPFRSNFFLEKLKPSIIIDDEDGVSAYVRKDFVNYQSGLALSRKDDGDVIITSGIFKRKSNYTEGQVLDGSNGLYYRTEKK